MLIRQPRRVVALGCSLAVLLLICFGYSLSPYSTGSSPVSILSTVHLSWNSQGPEGPPQKGNLLDDVFNTTLGFQKILVINLASRTDRRDTTSLAAAFTGLEVEYVDAVTHVDEKARPPGAKEVGLNPGGAGNWRSHMNVMRTIVEQNLSSALVLEDDADWDIRIKHQMRNFAKASRLLVQPLSGTTDQFLDPTYPQPDDKHREILDLDINSASTGTTTTSPYGDLDRWDMLWLGHCGCRFPWLEDKNVPLARAVIPNDPTVPARHSINIEFGDTQLLDQYPDYTRVVARSRINTCTLGYALSQAGARNLLYQVGISKIDGTFDMMMRSACDGSSGRESMICLSPQPALFNHFRPVGDRSSWSNIGEGAGEGYNEVASSTNIRWATRVNLPRLVKGEREYIDSYKDVTPAV